MSFHTDEIGFSTISEEEMTAQEYIERGEIDQAIAIYQQLEPPSARVFLLIGMLYANNKENFELAISYYEQALHMQEKDGHDISYSLTRLGFAYQSVREFDLALSHHLRAFNLRQLQPNLDQRLLADNLFGMANAYWGQENLFEALTCAQQALVINESLPSETNDSSIASILAILANIYHDSGDNIRALDLAQRALTLFEQCSSTNSLGLVSVLNNIGAIQVSAGLFDEALVTFVRLLHIYQTTLPEEHPTCIAINDNIRQIMTMQQQQQQNPLDSFSRLWKLSTKFLLF